MDRFLRQEPQATPLRRLAGGTSEHEKLCRARDQCREILKYVNEAVKQTENRHRVEGYQKRLDTTSLERASNPLAAEFKVRGGEQSALRHAHTPPGALRSRRVLGAGDVGCVGQCASWALAPWPPILDRCGGTAGQATNCRRRCSCFGREPAAGLSWEGRGRPVEGG